MHFNNEGEFLIQNKSNHFVQFKSVFKKVTDDILGFDDTRFLGFKKKNIAGELVDDILGTDIPREYRNPGRTPKPKTGTEDAPKEPPAGTVEEPEPQPVSPMPDPIRGEMKGNIAEYLRKRRMARRGRASTILGARRRARGEM